MTHLPIGDLDSDMVSVWLSYPEMFGDQNVRALLLWENVAEQGPDFPCRGQLFAPTITTLFYRYYLFTQLTLFIWGSPSF